MKKERRITEIATLYLATIPKQTLIMIPLTDPIRIPLTNEFANVILWNHCSKSNKFKHKPQIYYDDEFQRLTMS